MGYNRSVAWQWGWEEAVNAGRFCDLSAVTIKHWANLQPI